MDKKNLSLLFLALAIGLIIGKFAFNRKSLNDKKTETTVNDNKEHEISHWTCSMHPQIDMPEPGQCPICGMDLIPKTDQSNDNLHQNAVSLSPSALKLARVETLKIGEQANDSKESINLQLNARVSQNQDNTYTQAAHIGGRIEKLYIKAEGDFIRKGQRIALIYSPDLVAAQNELLQAMYIKNEQPELYSSVRQKLKYWKLSENQIRQIENTKKVVSNMPVYADYTGYVTQMKAHEGSHLKEGEAIYEVADLSKVWILADVYEKDLNKISKGQTVKIKWNAYPQMEIETKIDYIDPDVDAKTRTATARIVVRNKNHKLKPGMLAQVFVKNNQKTTSKTVVRIPKTAVLWTGKRSVVYLKIPSEENSFEMREVVLGESSGDKVEVISGLKKGDEIVVNGVFTIDASAQLLGKRSMMNPVEK